MNEVDTQGLDQLAPQQEIINEVDAQGLDQLAPQQPVYQVAQQNEYETRGAEDLSTNSEDEE